MAYIGQREDEWEWEQEKKRRRKKRRNSVTCPTCGKRVSKEGLADHLKHVHNQRIVPPKPPTIEVEDIPTQNN